MPLFFGRLDYASDLGAEHDETLYVGRRHITGEAGGEPLVIDWRAGMSLPFYRARPADPMHVRRRRRFGFSAGALTAYEDEELAGGGPADDDGAGLGDPAGRDRAAAHRADARHRRDHPARAGRHRPGRTGPFRVRPGRPGHRQDRRRAAPGGVPALRPPRAAGPLGRARGRPERQLPVLHRRRAARRSARSTPRRPRSSRCWPTPPVSRSAPTNRPPGPGSRATPGSPRSSAARSGATSPRPPPRWCCPAASTSGGCRPTWPTRSSPSSGSVGCATRPAARCSPSGSRTRSCCAWRPPATRPTTGSRRRSRAAARSRPTSPGSGRRSTRAGWCCGCSPTPRSSPPRPTVC